MGMRHGHGVLRDKVSSCKMRIGLEEDKRIEEITKEAIVKDLMCNWRLEWFGHVYRRDYEDIQRIFETMVDSNRKRGQPKQR